jgi:hypothetical protein
MKKVGGEIPLTLTLSLRGERERFETIGKLVNWLIGKLELAYH